MTQHVAIKVFEDKKVRTLWDEDKEKWYVSIVDVARILTDSPNANNYWKVLKKQAKKRMQPVGYKL